MIANANALGRPLTAAGACSRPPTGTPSLLHGVHALACPSVALRHPVRAAASRGSQSAVRQRRLWQADHSPGSCLPPLGRVSRCPSAWASNHLDFGGTGGTQYRLCFGALLGTWGTHGQDQRASRGLPFAIPLLVLVR